MTNSNIFEISGPETLKYRTCPGAAGPISVIRYSSAYCHTYLACMFPSASEPGGDGGLTVAENPFSRRRVQSFGQRGEHHGDVMGRGFQMVQGGVTPGSERRVTGLTPMCVVCQEGKMPAFFGHQSGLKTKNRAS